MRTAALLPILAACGSPPAELHVCDGSSDLRLAVRFDAPGPFAPGEAILYDNGASFLFVDGACHYAVKTGARWEDTAVGTADDAYLIDRLSLDQLVSGSYTGDIATAPTLHIAFEGAVIDCAAGCSGGDVPDEIAQLDARAADLLQLSFATGALESHPQRVEVVAEGVPPTPSFTWPATLDPATIALAPADAVGGTATLVTGADADALRDLRHQVRDTSPTPGAAYVTVDTGPPQYAVFLRDALPWEDASGVVADPL